MKATLAAAVLAVLALGGCSGNSQNASSQNSPASMATMAGNAVNSAATAAGNAMSGAATMASNAMHAAGAGAAAMMHGVTVPLAAENGSGESGKALLTPTGNKTTVTISLSGENTTGKQPVHIHIGACANPGAVKYPLSDVVLGKSVSVVDAPLSTLTAGNLVINVHESGTDITKYVACGVIAKH